MLIGELATRAGVTIRAVRYYEAQGLVRAARKENGYRDYGEEDVRVVREVRSLLSLGLTAEQTYPFIDCLRAGNARADVCPASLAAYRARIDELDVHIAEMVELRARLGELLADAEQ